MIRVYCDLCSQEGQLGKCNNGELPLFRLELSDETEVAAHENYERSVRVSLRVIQPRTPTDRKVQPDKHVCVYCALDIINKIDKRISPATEAPQVLTRVGWIVPGYEGADALVPNSAALNSHNFRGGPPREVFVKGEL